MRSPSGGGDTAPLLPRPLLATALDLHGLQAWDAGEMFIRQFHFRRQDQRGYSFFLFLFLFFLPTETILIKRNT